MWRYGIIIRRRRAHARPRPPVAQQATFVTTLLSPVAMRAGVACHIHMQSNGGEGEPHGRKMEACSYFHNDTKSLRTTPPFTYERTFW